jgi:GNAT superfamily N-acetyltransferase
MQELSRSRFALVAPLVEAVPFDRVFARAVVRGFQSGKIFADDPEDPRLALVHHFCGAALLCGSAGGPAADAALSAVVDLLLARDRPGGGRFRLYCHPGVWNEKLAAALGRRLLQYSDFESAENADAEAACRRILPGQDDHVVAWTRVRFAFDERAFRDADGRCAGLPEGFAFAPVDPARFEEAAGTVVPKIFWDSADQFRRNGFGFCLVAPDGRIASASFAAYVDGEEVDVGIETDPAWRGRGLAERVCRRMIENCLERGLRPVWGCRKDNIGSRRLARKLGFSEIQYHPTYFGVLPPQPA